MQIGQRAAFEKRSSVLHGPRAGSCRNRARCASAWTVGDRIPKNPCYYTLSVSFVVAVEPLRLQHDGDGEGEVREARDAGGGEGGGTGGEAEERRGIVGL